MFARDRRRYLRWLFEAKKRLGLCVPNYVVTSNRIHLLVKDKHRDVDEAEGTYALHEPRGAYTLSFEPENSALRANNTIF